MYDTPEARIRIRQRNRQFLFFLLFLCGTIIAGIGWFADWEHLADRIAFFRYSTFIAIAGHAIQVIGAFGSLITPDYAEQEEDEEES